jgi:hypothetical protein
MPVPVAARSKAWVCGPSPAEIFGSNSTGGMDVLSVCECCVLSDKGLCDGLITRPEESYLLWCVVVCDLETLWMRRPWPTWGLSRQKQTYILMWFLADRIDRSIVHTVCSSFKTCAGHISGVHVQKQGRAPDFQNPFSFNIRSFWLRFPRWYSCSVSGDYTYKYVATSPINGISTALHWNMHFINVSGNSTYQMHANTYMDFLFCIWFKKVPRTTLERNKYSSSPNSCNRSSWKISQECLYLYIYRWFIYRMGGTR